MSSLAGSVGVAVVAAVVGAVAKEVTVGIIGLVRRQKVHDKLKQYEGTWWGYYFVPNPSGGVYESEEWCIGASGRVAIMRNKLEVFRGELVVKNAKIYAYLDRCDGQSETLFIEFDEPRELNGKTDELWGIWVGQDNKRFSAAGFGLLSRRQTEVGRLENLNRSVLEVCRDSDRPILIVRRGRAERMEPA